MADNCKLKVSSGGEHVLQRRASNWRYRNILRSTLAASACVLSGSLDGTGLVDNSPFIPDGFDPLRAAPKKSQEAESIATRDIELRGIYSLDGVYQFSIYNKREHSGEWVGLNDPGATYRILGFDETTNTIQLNLDGTEEELTLKKRDNKPLPVKTATVASTRGKPAAGSAQARRTGRSANPASGQSSRQRVVRRRVITPNQSRTAQGQRNTRTTTSTVRRNPNQANVQTSNRRIQANQPSRQIQASQAYRSARQGGSATSTTAEELLRALSGNQPVKKGK